MKFTTFEQQNLVLAEDQPEYNQLPVNLNPEIDEKPMHFAIEFEESDYDQLRANGNKMFFTQLTFGQPFQPVAMSIQTPEQLSALSKEELLDVLAAQKAERDKIEAARKRLPVRLGEFKMESGEVKLLPMMANGDYIPNIAKDSLKLISDPDEMKAGIIRLEMQVFVHVSDVKDLDLTKFPGIAALVF